MYEACSQICSLTDKVLGNSNILKKEERVFIKYLREMTLNRSYFEIMSNEKKQIYMIGFQNGVRQITRISLPVLFHE